MRFAVLAVGRCGDGVEGYDIRKRKVCYNISKQSVLCCLPAPVDLVAGMQRCACADVRLSKAFIWTLGAICPPLSSPTFLTMSNDKYRRLNATRRRTESVSEASNRFPSSSAEAWQVGGGGGDSRSNLSSLCTLSRTAERLESFGTRSSLPRTRVFLCF